MNIVFSFLFIIFTAMQGFSALPPTSAKGSGDATFATTFQFDFGAFPLTRSGTRITVGSLPLPSGVTGILPIANGGTGQSSFVSGFVRSNGSALFSLPSVSLSSDVTGTLPIGNGGTGQTSFSSGFIKSNGSALSSSATVNMSSDVTGVLQIANGGTNNGSLGVTAGGVVYTDGSKLANVGAGTSGYYLRSNGSSAPTWVPQDAKVTAGAYMSVSAGTGAATPINYDTIQWDINSAITTPGGLWRFTAPKAAKYHIQAFTIASGTSASWVGVYKNGSLLQRINYSSDLASIPQNGGATVNLALNDYIDIRGLSTFTALGGSLSSGVCSITITEVAQ